MKSYLKDYCEANSTVFNIVKGGDGVQIKSKLESNQAHYLRI
jgi:hypothetical protein